MCFILVEAFTLVIYYKQLGTPILVISFVKAKKRHRFVKTKAILPQGLILKRYTRVSSYSNVTIYGTVQLVGIIARLFQDKG